MNSAISLSQWNRQTLNLVQALLGAVSSNFRMVALGHDGATWLILVVIERENHADMDEIEDLLPEFEALQDCAVPARINTVVCDGALPWPAPPTRVVFRRRQP